MDAAAGESSVSLTIDSVWKATGYTVKYGASPSELTEQIYIDRAEVEQLLIPGLETSETYWFAAAAHNGNVVSAFSSPVFAVTEEERGSQELIVASVVKDSLRFPFYRDHAEIQISALSLFAQPQTLTVKVEGLPPGATVPEELSFTAKQWEQIAFTIPVTVSSAIERGKYTVDVSVLNGEDMLITKKVTLNLIDSDILLRDDFSADTSENYTKTGSGSFAIAEGSLSATTTGALLITTGETGWSNYVVESDMTMGGTANATSAGLVFYYQDEKNFYHVRIDETYEAFSLQLYSWLNGTGSRIASIPVERAADDVYHLRCDVSDGGAEIYLNDERIISVEMALSGGKAGFRSYARNVDFDGLYVYQVAAESPSKHTITVNGGTTDKATAAEGDTVTITAGAPTSGKVFEKWTTEDGVIFASASSAKSVSDWAKEAVGWATEKEILTGKGQNNLDLAGTATRAETAAIFMRLSNIR